MWARNRTESPERDPHTYAHLILENSTKAIHWRKNSSFQSRFWKKLDVSVQKIMNLNTSLPLHENSPPGIHKPGALRMFAGSVTRGLWGC